MNIKAARAAFCFSLEDKRKLLAAITLAFGSLQPFNEVVRTMLAGRTERALPNAAAASAAGGAQSTDGRAVGVLEFAGPAHTLNKSAAKQSSGGGGFIHALNRPFAAKRTSISNAEVKV